MHGSLLTPTPNIGPQTLDLAIVGLETASAFFSVPVRTRLGAWGGQPSVPKSDHHVLTTVIAVHLLLSNGEKATTIEFL